MKIFIIEDEPAIREELVQLLQKYGYQCDSSDDFHHIVQAALSSGANLILLDINIATNIGLTIVLFLLVYGSYFIATYLSCKRIVTEQRELEV